MTSGGSISTSPVSGGGGQELIDHLRRRDLGHGGEHWDLEEVLEALLGRLTLVALAGEDPEQVPALGLGHRLAPVSCSGGATNGSRGSLGRAIAARPRRARRSCWPRTRSGVYYLGLQADAIQLLEGDDTDIDGVTEGAGLGPGFGHTDQMRDEELIDVLGTGIA